MKKLYTWNWLDGGYNQTYAESAKAAIDYAYKAFKGIAINVSTLHECTPEEERLYWKHFPIFD
jgi:hypothetical protein